MQDGQRIWNLTPDFQGALHAGGGHLVQDRLGQGISRPPERRRQAAKMIIGAIMRKLLHVAYGILKMQQPFNPRSPRSLTG